MNARLKNFRRWTRALPTTNYWIQDDLHVKQWRLYSTSDSPVSPLSASAQHTSLSSFLAYAQRTGLSPSSTVYIGTLYEYQSQTALSALGFQLLRSGGRADAGVDLFGTWNLPSQSRKLRCIVQCKALARKVGPNLVRELEGAFAGAPVGWQSDEVVGVLCATREATKGVRDAVRRSARGIVWVMIEEGRENEVGAIKQVVWNQRVAELGAMGVSAGLVYQRDAGVDVEKEVRLMWEGEIWKPELAPVSKDQLEGREKP